MFQLLPGYHPDALDRCLPFGAIIGSVVLEAVYEIGEMGTLVPGKRPPMCLTVGGTLEAQFGDYTPGRKAWRLERPIRIDPIPYRGEQAMFDVPDAIVSEQIARAAVESTQGRP
jgi:hypothetical protein